MSRRSTFRFWISLVATLCVAVFTIHLAGAPQAARQAPQKRRFLVVAKTEADVDALRADVATAGGTVVHDLGQIGALAVSGTDAIRERLRASAFAAGVATDHVIRLIEPARAREMRNGATGRHSPPTAFFRRPAPTPDPAFSLTGLMWSIQRTNAPQAWKTTLGSAAVKVGVADTGLDFTHSELAPRILDVVDFTATEDPPICSTYFGASDADLAAFFGGPEKTDWNGHGSWIGGNIGAALDGKGVNGIAPKVGLVALRSRSGAAPRTIPKSSPRSSTPPITGLMSSTSRSAGISTGAIRTRTWRTRSMSRRCDMRAGTERRLSLRPATNTSGSARAASCSTTAA